MVSSLAKYAIGLLPLLFVMPNIAGAVGFTFDDYNNGELHGQDGWLQDSGDTDRFTVSSSYVSSGKSVSIEGGSCSGNVCYASTSSSFTGDVFYVSAQFYADDLRDGEFIIGISENETQRPCFFGFSEVTTDKLVVMIDGLTTKSLGQPATSTWTSIGMKVDNTDDTCTLFYGDQSTTTSFNSGEAPISQFNTIEIRTIDNLSFNDTVFSIDNINVSNASSSQFNNCDSCTRIVDIISPEPEIVYFVTPDVSVEYYVNSADVIDTDNVFIEFVYNSVKSIAFAQTELTNYSGGREAQINIFDTSYFFNDIIDDLTATGTHNAYFHIYERIDSPWWKFWNSSFTKKTLAKQSYRFFMFDQTSAYEVAALYENEQQITNEQASICISDYLSYQCLREELDTAVNAFMYAPPIGYVTYLVRDILMATTTSTSSIGFVVSFPTTSPAYGKTLNLDISGALSNSIAELDNTVLPGQTGSVLVNLMEYWTWFLRIALGFYILKRVFDIYSLSVTYNPNGGEYQRSGSVRGIGRGSTGMGDRYTTDMSGGQKQRSGHSRIGHGIKIKSYD